MTADLPPEIGFVVLAVLLGASAFFSGSETAIFSLQPEALQRLRGARRHERLDSLLDQPDRTLAAILVGNELVNIAISTLSAVLVVRAWSLPGWANLLLATPLLILFGEVLPKTVALRTSVTWARLVARPLGAWVTLTAPIRFLLGGVANRLTRLFGVRSDGGRTGLDPEAVRRLVEEGRRAGSIREVERDLIHKVFRFGDIPVGRLMTPRPDIIAVPLTTAFDDLLEVVRRHRVSRIPVYRNGLDDISGILMAKDLLPFRGRKPPGHRELMALVKPVPLVPSFKRAEDMLREFQRRRSHMAIVVDEHGSVAGLLTLDDILRELVGQLLDEDEEPPEEIDRIRPDVWTVSGGMDLEDFAEATGIRLPEGDYATLAGFVLDRLGHVPAKGESFVHDGLRFEVTGLEGHRIVEVGVRRLEPLTECGGSRP